MDINTLTLGQIKEIQALIGSLQKTKPDINHGQNIVVLDRGFVYVGNVMESGDYLTISNAKNIRYWGTTKGLGELVNGPLKETKLDEIGTVKAPLRAVIHLVPVNGFVK